MAPAYRAPAPAVAAMYAPQQPLPGALEDVPAWQDYFTDPQMQALIAQALRGNRDLRMTVLRVQEARALYGIQRSDLFPVIGGQASLDRARVPGDLNLTGQPIVTSQYQVGLGVSTWEIDFWGRVRSLQDAALQAFLATAETRRAATLALIAQVANSYLLLIELDERIDLARSTLASRQESLRIFSRRVAVGSTSRLDLTQVETLAAQADALHSQLEQARAAQVAALTLLVGASPEPFTTPLRLDSQPDGGSLLAGVPSDLLERRPDIMAAEHRLRAANANIGAARAAFFPRIALTGSLGTASTDLDGLFAGGSGAWSFAPSISLPLFDGGRRRSGLQLSEVRRDLAVADYEKTVQGAFRDVSNALSARRWLTDQVSIAMRSQRIQTERARLSRLRYDNGAASFLEVLDAERDLLSARQQVVQTRRGLLSNRVDLYAALGGSAAVLEPALP